MDSNKRQKKDGTFFSEEELTIIETENPNGFSSGEVVDILSRRGMRFSEATFRKYVQVGLLPRSRRVGSKGKHKGSRGVYPAGVIRQINEIKQMMSLDYTIEDIRQHFAFIGGEIEELRTLLERILERLEGSLAQDESQFLPTTGLRHQIAEARQMAEALVTKLNDSAQRIREVKQLEREAV